MEEFWNNLVSSIETYGPNILVAFLILVGSWIVAGLLKWGLTKGIDSTGFGKKANDTTPGEASLGKSIGLAAFWIVILIGIVLALSQLGLRQIVDPLNEMLGEVLTYLPKVFGAVILFVVFVIVANVVAQTCKAVLVFADPVPERIGLASGPVNISGITANILSAIVIILGAIAAFDVLAIDAISVPANAMLQDIVSAIPNILVAAIILTVFGIIARFVGSLIRSTLPNFGVDRAANELGLLKGADTGLTASKVIANLAVFFIVLLGLIEALSALHFDGLTEAMYMVLQMGASIVFGAVIIFAGVFLARLISNAIATTGSGASDTAASVVKWAIIVLSVILGVSRMELDPTGGTFVLDVAEMIVMGAAVGLAIAIGIGFGWGGRDWFGRQLEKWRPSDKPPLDKM